MSNAKILMYTTKWCSDCRRVKMFLQQKQVDYDEVDIEENSEAAEIVEKLNNGFRSVPTIIFPDGTVTVEPSNQELEKLLLDKNLL